MIALSHVTFCFPPLSSFHHAYGVEAVFRCCETSGSEHLDSRWQISIYPGPDVSIPSGGFGQARLPSRLLSYSAAQEGLRIDTHAYQRTTTAGPMIREPNTQLQTATPARADQQQNSCSMPAFYEVSREAEGADAEVGEGVVGVLRMPRMLQALSERESELEGPSGVLFFFLPPGGLGRSVRRRSIRDRVWKYWDTSLPRRVEGRRSYFVPTNDSAPRDFAHLLW